MKFLNDMLGFLLPEGVKYVSGLLFLRDAAPYIAKTASELKVLYTKLVHPICLAYGLNHVPETMC